jgi:hypothetical protein
VGGLIPEDQLAPQITIEFSENREAFKGIRIEWMTPFSLFD